MNTKKDMEHSDYVYDDETLDILEERQEEYKKGNIMGFTIEESMEHIKNELKKRGL